MPRERLLKASLLMAFYTVRSERLFPSSGLQPAFPFRPQHVLQNRARLMQDDVAKLRRLGGSAGQQARPMSLEHFSVDGTLVDAGGRPGAVFCFTGETERGLPSMP